MPNTGSNHNAEEASNECQLKAGHLPAVKVAGMRVVQRTHSSSSTSDKNDVAGDNTVTDAVSFAPKTVAKSLGGAPPIDTIPYQAEAVKQFHDKPEPTHDLRNHSTKPHNIQQPKK